jgi:hypothetical protein
MSRGTFCVWVSGRLADDFAKAFDPEMEQGETENGSTLSGELVDQAQIRGLLDRLGNLGIDVVRFETYPRDSEVRTSSGN